MTQLTRMSPFQYRVLEAAVRAPSGDNCQPWSFCFEDAQTLRVAIVPERAASFFDHAHAATYLSVGTVVENVRVAAACEHMEMDVTYGRDPTAACRLVFRPDPHVIPERNRLSALFRRTVNRHPFVPRPVPPGVLRALLGDPVPGTSVELITTRPAIAGWARVIELADRIRYSHPVIHEELFATIRWTPEEADRLRTGLEVDRLGLGPLARPLLRSLRPWPRVKRWSRWGLITALAKQSHWLARACGALVLVAGPGKTPADWIRVGEQVQRLWIAAEEAGWHTHPMPVCLYLDHRYRLEGLTRFLPEHAPLLAELRSELSRLITDGVGGMLFRLGRGLPVRGRSVRLPVDAFVTPCPHEEKPSLQRR
ncbi:hypothetical protein [Candidatus Nitrospira bockiana]